MTDYTDLINELTWFAEQDKDFIALHESINTKAAQAIRQLVIERDAAFAMSKCECETNEACKNLVALHDEVERLEQERGAALVEFNQCSSVLDDTERHVESLESEITTLKSALREAKEALDSCEWYSPGSCYLFDPDAVEKAIATIKEVIK